MFIAVLLGENGALYLIYKIFECYLNFTIMNSSRNEATLTYAWYM